MKRIHHAWLICAACLLLYLCNSGLLINSLSTYLPFIEATGISDSAGSAILSVRSLFSFVTIFFVGWYYQKVSLRMGILVGTLIGAVSALVFSIGGSAAVYYAGAALAGISKGNSKSQEKDMKDKKKKRKLKR